MASLELAVLHQHPEVVEDGAAGKPEVRAILMGRIAAFGDGTSECLDYGSASVTALLLLRARTKYTTEESHAVS